MPPGPLPVPPPVGPDVRVVLVGRAGCHLCDVVREVIDRVCTELDVPWAERSVTEEAELLEAYGELVPVTLVDGVQHDYWRIDEGRFRRALGATGP